MNTFAIIKSAVDSTFDPPLRLPPGRTEREALAVAKKWKDHIWNGAAGQGLDEDQKIVLFEDTCTDLCSKHRASGKALASRAIWS